jgi:hypothetical protein
MILSQGFNANFEEIVEFKTQFTNEIRDFTKQYISKMFRDINTNVLTTITLPNPATYPGKELHLRQTGTGYLQSASSNIIPFLTPPTGSTSTAILLTTNNKSCTLVSDGTNWIIMQRSEN